MLKGVQGPYQNRYFRLKAGMAIGRKQGDILLDEDPMVSSLHGNVISRQSGRLSLEDAGSSNQFLTNGQKVAKLDLIPGVIFQVGQCVFEVIEVNEDEAKRLAPSKGWRELIFETLERNSGLQASKAAALTPALKIECLEGPNAEDIWFLGFGPRLFGPLCEDIEILEKDSSDVSFEIYQGLTGPYLKSKTSHLTLNNRIISQDTETNLSDGDEIRIGVSVFKVRFT